MTDELVQIVNAVTGKKDEKKKKSGGNGGLIRQYHPPYYNVVSGGVTIEWTDKLSEATNAFKDASAKPAYIYQIHGADVRCVGAKL